MTKAEREEWKRRGFADPVARYRQHAVNAGRRGIPFELSFDEWWSIWGPGYERRGRMRGQLVMCRTKDQGAYAVGNVRVDTVAGNARDAVAVRQIQNRSQASNWLQEQYRSTMGYFKAREIAEEHEERGEDWEAC